MRLKPCRINLHGVGGHHNIWIYLPDRLFRGVHLEHAHPVGGVGDLTLQIGEVDPVVIDQCEMANPGTREVKRYRAAQATSADHQRMRT